MFLFFQPNIFSTSTIATTYKKWLMDSISTGIRTNYSSASIVFLNSKNLVDGLCSSALKIGIVCLLYYFSFVFPFVMISSTCFLSTVSKPDANSCGASGMFGIAAPSG